MEVNVLSRNGVPVRLTDERWAHITEEHSELAGLRFDILAAVNQADAVYEGFGGELLAARQVEPRKWLVVVYREFELDGFIITAFLTSRKHYVERRQRLWP